MLCLRCIKYWIATIHKSNIRTFQFKSHQKLCYIIKGAKVTRSSADADKPVRWI